MGTQDAVEGHRVRLAPEHRRGSTNGRCPRPCHQAKARLVALS
jgi:hypothetical protein